MTEAASQIATQDFAALEHPYQPAPMPLLPIWRAEPATDGRLRIAGPALFSGKLRRDVGEWVFEPRTSDWHQTEDRVNIEDGYLTLLGRVDSLVKVLGELVNPEAIERQLAALSGGALDPGAFVVVAVPDARAEHRLVPVFDASADAAVIRNALLAHAEKAPGFLKLSKAVTLENFPRSPLGKPLRAEIAARIIAPNPHP
jgi:O-succinylbenzoic acid--CoA ligase